MPRLTVAHDFICPWCWVAWEQAKKLAIEFPTLELDWVGFELLPEGLDYTPSVPESNAPKKPRIPGRFELLLLAEGLTLPERTHSFSRSRKALEGVEYAKTEGKANAYLGGVYHAYWEEDRDIADREVLKDVAAKAGLDVAAFTRALEERTYRDTVVEYDDPAHAAGIWNVPTWEFPEEWVAEQPYSLVREMAARFVEQETK